MNLGLVMCVGILGCSGTTVAQTIQLDKPAPEIRANDIEGHSVRLDDWHGRVVLLNFWATWCPPCLDEIPDLVELAKEFKPKGAAVVGMNVDVDQPHRLATFAKRFGITYPIVLTTPALLDAYRVSVIPTSFLIDQEGKVRKRYLGPRSREEFAQDIRALLAAARPTVTSTASEE